MNTGQKSTDHNSYSQTSGKFHNPSIYCLKNCSTWRLKVCKTQTPFSNTYGKKFDLTDKENFQKTFILSKMVAIRGQEYNVDFMQDLQEADNFTSMDNVTNLDTGYDKTKETLSQVEGMDKPNTENSSALLNALLPIQNDNRTSEFSHLNANTGQRDNLI